MTHRYSGLEMWLTRSNLATNNPGQSSCHCFRKDQRKKKHLCRDEKTENYWLKNQTDENFEIWFRLYQGFFDKWSQKSLKICQMNPLESVTNIILLFIVCLQKLSGDGELFCPINRILVLNLALLNCFLDIIFGKKDIPCTLMVKVDGLWPY